MPVKKDCIQYPYRRLVILSQYSVYFSKIEKNINRQGAYPALTTQKNDDISINFKVTQKTVGTHIDETVVTRIDLSKLKLVKLD